MNNFDPPSICNNRNPGSRCISQSSLPPFSPSTNNKKKVFHRFHLPPIIKKSLPPFSPSSVSRECGGQGSCPAQRTLVDEKTMKYKNIPIFVTFRRRCCSCCSGCCCCCCCRRCCCCWRGHCRAFASTVFPMTATRHMNSILVNES